jgi:hypothetical protein
VQQRTRPRVLLALAALLLLGAPAVPAATAGPLDSLVVSGAAATRGTWTLAAPVKLDLRAIDVRTTGTYGGVYIRSASGVDYGGGVWVQALHQGALPAGAPAVRSRAKPLYGAQWGQPTLPAGTYTVHLLGDATTEVTVPVVEGAGATVTTSTPGSQVLRTVGADVAADSDAGTETTSVRYPFTKPAKTLSFVMAEFSSTLGTEAPSIALCLRQSRSGRCASMGTSSGPSTTGGGVGIDTVLRPARRAQGWRADVSVSSTTTNGGRLALAYLQLGV